MTNTLDVGNQYINVDGHMVERDALLVAEAINEYDPKLKVICLPPEKADINDAPFIIAHEGPDGVLRRVFECWQLDHSVLARIEAADTTRHDVQAKIDWINAEARRASKKRYEEKRLIKHEIGTSVIASKKSSFSYKDPDTGELVTIYDNKPSERK
jgi:hypothetical protein